MVRIYQRKTERATSYNKEQLQQALEDVRPGKTILHTASRNCAIPKTTMHNHLTGVRGKKNDSLGRGPVIHVEHERKLAEGLKTLKKWGFGLSKREVLLIVSDFVTQNNIRTPFLFTHSSDDLSDIDPALDDDSLDELSDIYPPLDDDSLDNDSLDDLVEDILDDDMGNNIENVKEDFKSGQWLVVKYTGKKSVKYFIGTIVGFDEENNNPTVKFAKKKNNNYTFYWPDNDDTDTVSRENIAMILPDPAENRRGKSFQFNVYFIGLNFVC
ncbi:uncharacterized protein LOC114333194 [Diabrotica virgifera virgifera]|uniref:Uncharacterized protein LOC114333194 n=1 Tax=Diabrotica virgifera virgifera TaxID=50390 RepID=A0A6P7G1D6_DIAVI|nr:uncharacterized protein LOC114333194 [Diabrotica virgifera virgifera]